MSTLHDAELFMDCGAARGEHSFWFLHLYGAVLNCLWELLNASWDVYWQSFVNWYHYTQTLLWASQQVSFSVSLQFLCGLYFFSHQKSPHCIVGTRNVSWKIYKRFIKYFHYFSTVILPKVVPSLFLRVLDLFVGKSSVSVVLLQFVIFLAVFRNS